MLKRFFGKVASFCKAVWAYALRHKIQAGAAVVVLILLGYWGFSSYQKSVTTTQYVLAMARIAPIEQTVTGSGQVASEHQLNLSPKASGTLTSVTVKTGQQVGAGQVIATVDNTDAARALRDASANLESARISYEQSLTSTSGSVDKSHDTAYAADTTAFADMGTDLEGMDSIMQGSEVSGSYAVRNMYAYSQLFENNPDVVSYRDKAIASYTAANAAYQSALSDFHATSRTSDAQSVANVSVTAYNAAVLSAQAASDLNDYLNLIHQRLSASHLPEPSVLSTQLSSMGSYVSSLNSDVNSVLSAKNDLESAIQTSSNDSQPLSVQSAQLSYQKAQNAYEDAKANLADYVVVAPFPGTIAQVNLQKYDQASASTPVAVLVTKQQYATLSLNEVDASKVQVGQPATLTFDAIDGLTLDGTVAEVDSVGTVSQGVVSYTVKIGFDTQDTRILPGMTVNATIVTASKQDALVIPSSAIKTRGSETYVEIASYTPAGSAAASSTRSANRFRTASSTGAFASSTRSFGSSTGAFASRGTDGPTVDASSVTVRRVPVTTGIESDTMTEITSGLTEGEFVIAQSLNASGKSTGQTPSLLNLFGGRRAGATTTGAGAARTTTGGTGGARTGAPAGNAVFRGG